MFVIQILLTLTTLSSIFTLHIRNQMTPIYRLPDDVRPWKYVLKMVPILDEKLPKFTFSGEVEIHTNIQWSTKTILLNSHKLDINSVQVSYRGSSIPSVYSLQSELQLLNVTTARKLRRNRNVTLKITFSGVQSDEMRGFYGTKYDHYNRETKWLATTQCEPAAARMIFPCFDEARFKAIFKISVARSNKNPYHSSISLMPLESTSDPDSSVNYFVWDNFKPTPPISTHSVSFIVGEYSFIFYEGEKLPVITVSRANNLVDIWYPYDMATALREKMNEYSIGSYILPKINILGMPDIGFGAVKRLELLGHREFYTARDKESVAKALAHEIAHRWFGDNVSPYWWDSLWLDRGFSTYFQYYLTGEVELSWRMKEKFVVEAVHEALSLDGVHIHRPLNASVKSIEEIQELYDEITYYKGAALLRMIENLVGPYTFRKAVHWFINAKIHPDVKEAVLCVAVKNDPTSSTWNKLWETFKESNEDIEKRMILKSLGCSTNDSILMNYLFKLVENTNGLYSEHVIPVIQSVIVSSQGITTSINYIRALLPSLSETYKTTLPIILSLLSELKPRVKLMQHLNQLHDLISEAENFHQSVYVDVRTATEEVKMSALSIMKFREETIPELSGALVSGFMTTSTPKSKAQVPTERVETLVTASKDNTNKENTSFFRFPNIFLSWLKG